MLVGRAYGMSSGFPSVVINAPIYAEPNSVCSETYVVIGPFENEETCQNVISYIKTMFFRFMVALVKTTQDAPKRVYQLVPQQDFSNPWCDKELFQKYNLTDAEIAYIEKMIKPME